MIRTLLQFVVPKTLPGRLIVVIVSLDTIWTAIAVYGGMARESNPWMAKLVALGPFVYIPVGLLRPIALVRTVEWLRKFNGWGKMGPQFADRALWAGVGIYLAIYIVGSIGNYLLQHSL